MSTPSFVDRILRSISHLPRQPLSVHSTADLSSRYTTDQRTSSTTNPLNTLSPSASQDAKSLFLTLHFLFPHELLPALDLLDRGLVTTMIPSTNINSDPDTTATSYNEVFYIQSASAQLTHGGPRNEADEQGRFRNALSGKGNATQTFYEVRLDSWNCSCAAFAFSAFNWILKGDGDEDLGARQGEANRERQMGVGDEDRKGSGDGEPRDWTFGGSTTRHDVAAGVPVCKHILAAVIARAAPEMFVVGVHISVRRNVGMYELAGWGAGWGDGG